MLRWPMGHWFVAGVAGLAGGQPAPPFTPRFFPPPPSPPRSMPLCPGVGGVSRAVTWIPTGISPRQWVAVHRKHHAFTDIEGDPHSPILLGFSAVQFGNVGLYRKVAKDNLQVQRYARDLPPDRWDRIFFDRAIPGLTI